MTFSLSISTDSQSGCGYSRGIIRLQGGRHEREGRVEVCNDDQWGQVCASGWDGNDAAVVCRQLGLLSADTGGYSYIQFLCGPHLCWLDSSCLHTY